MEKLKDIKPLVAIPDYSFYIYTFLLIVLTVIGIVLIFFIIRKLSVKKVSRREKILKELESLSLDDSKKVAYLFTKKGRYLVHDKSSLKIYEELLRRLGRYKYKTEVPPLDKETRHYIRLFLKMGRNE